MIFIWYCFVTLYHNKDITCQFIVDTLTLLTSLPKWITSHAIFSCLKFTPETRHQSSPTQLCPDYKEKEMICSSWDFQWESLWLLKLDTYLLIQLPISIPSRRGTQLRSPRNSQCRSTKYLAHTTHNATHNSPARAEQTMGKPRSRLPFRNHRLPIQNPPSKFTQCHSYACTRISLLDGGVSFV